MSISRTGTYTEVDSSSQTSNSSITIPADAEILVVLVEGYATSNPLFAAGSLTIGGLTLTRAVKYDTDANVHATAIYYYVSPPTGAQTLAWSWTSALSSGAIMTCVCYKGINTSSPIVDSDATFVNASGTTISITGLTQGANDWTIGIAGSDSSATPDVDTGGQTKILESATYNGSKVGVAEKANSGTWTCLACDYPSACAIVLAAAAGMSSGHVQIEDRYSKILTEASDRILSEDGNAILAEDAVTATTDDILTEDGFYILQEDRQYKSLAGILLATGAATKYTSVGRAGVLTAIGTVYKKAQVVRAGVLSAIGAVARSKVNLKALAGVFSFIGSVVKYGKVKRAGILTATGTATKYSRITRVGVLSAVGVAKKCTRATRAGVLAFAGAAGKRAQLLRAGALAFTGTAAKMTSKKLAGLVSAIGSVAGQLVTGFSQYVGGILAFSGGVKKGVGKRLTGALSFVGAWISHLIAKPGEVIHLSGSFCHSVSMSGSFIRSVSMSGVITRSVPCSGGFTRTIELSGELQ